MGAITATERDTSGSPGKKENKPWRSLGKKRKKFLIPRTPMPHETAKA